MNVVTNNNIKCTVARAGLENVYGPESGLNVVDLGLLYEINFSETEKKVICTMTLTTEFCPMGESIVEGVRQSLQSSFPDHAIEVNLTFQPLWNYQRISEKGKEFLGR